MVNSVAVTIYNPGSPTVEVDHSSGNIASGTVLQLNATASRVCVSITKGKNSTWRIYLWNILKAPCNENAHFIYFEIADFHFEHEDTRVKMVGCAFNTPGKLPWRNVDQFFSCVGSCLYGDSRQHCFSSIVYTEVFY